jgi:hypothetical protein
VHLINGVIVIHRHGNSDGTAAVPRHGRSDGTGVLRRHSSVVERVLWRHSGLVERDGSTTQKVTDEYETEGNWRFFFLAMRVTGGWEGGVAFIELCIRGVVHAEDSARSLHMQTQNIFSFTYHIESLDVCMEH